MCSKCTDLLSIKHIWRTNINQGKWHHKKLLHKMNICGTYGQENNHSIISFFKEKRRKEKNWSHSCSHVPHVPSPTDHKYIRWYLNHDVLDTPLPRTESVGTAACYSKANHHKRSQALKISAIVNNNAKHNDFVLAKGNLSKSSTRAKLSDVAQYGDNANRAALSYVNAAEIKDKSHANGHTPSQVTTQRQWTN